MQAAAVERLALQAKAGVEQLVRALPVGHVYTQAFAGLAEAHVVFKVAGQEWRDMKGLGHGDMLLPRTAGRQHIVVTLVPGCVADFAENGHEALVGIKAIKEARRVECQAPTARLGQQAHGAAEGLAEGFCDLLAHGINQAHASTSELRQVVAFAETERRPTAASGQGRQAEYGVLFVQVEVEQAHAVAEVVGPRRKAPMADPAAVQGAVHASASPNARATRRPLTTPSS